MTSSSSPMEAAPSVHRLYSVHGDLSCVSFLQVNERRVPYYYYLGFKTYSLSLRHSHHPQRRNHAAHFFLQTLAPRSDVSMDFLLLPFHINATIYWKKSRYFSFFVVTCSPGCPIFLLLWLPLPRCWD